jgi:hypothetical protein
MRRQLALLVQWMMIMRVLSMMKISGVLALSVAQLMQTLLASSGRCGNPGRPWAASLVSQAHLIGFTRTDAKTAALLIRNMSKARLRENYNALAARRKK